MNDLAAPKILLVDDREENLFSLRKILKPLGISTVECTSGQEALMITIQHDFCLAIIDVQMPEMDGYELVELMHGNPKTMKLPVIFVSAIYSDTYHYMRGYGTGAVYFLSKPFIPEILLSKVQVFLNLYKQRKKLERLVTELHTKNESLEIEIEHRKKVEAELAQERSRLTQHVAERTMELRQANVELEEAVRLKDRFLANISHELRTPLNGILGYAQLLQQDSNLTANQQDKLTTMQQSGDYLLTIINDILDISKIQVGKIDLQPIKINLKEFLKKIVLLFRTRANEKNIAFTYEPLADLPAWVKVDEKRLRQVLTNLLGNAIKFTQKGGVIFAIDVLNKNIPHDCTLQFKIIDSGIGIKPENLELMFTPFRQVGTRLGKSEGAGLGLSISKRLIDLMNGELHVKSIFGQGCTFWFDLALPLAGAWTETTYLSMEQESISEDKTTSYILPPQAEINELFKLAMIGNITRIKSYIEQLKKLPNNHNPFLNEIHTLAKQYRIKKIREFLKPYVK